MSNPTPCCAGIDVAKRKLDVALDRGEAVLTVGNDAAGHRALAAFLTGHGVGRVALEATGPYGLAVTAFLRGAGFTVLVLQPVQVKLYRRMRLGRAKNDLIDAALIARYAALADSRPDHDDPRLAPLAEALTFLEQIEDDIVRLQTRRDRFGRPDLKRALERQIAAAQKQAALHLARLLGELGRIGDLARRMALLVSIPGIGPRTAAMLVVRMPELGHVSREQIAALAGLAPFDDDSGDSKKPRHIAGGRGKVRCRLYLPTLAAATRWNPDLARFYKRLRDAGKPAKLALTAAMRKLLIIANAVLARNAPWHNAAPEH
jgi:transposase